MNQLCFFQDGATPLWIACQMGHPLVVKELLENSADVDTAREVGYQNVFTVLDE